MLRKMTTMICSTLTDKSMRLMILMPLSLMIKSQPRMITRRSSMNHKATSLTHSPTLSQLSTFLPSMKKPRSLRSTIMIYSITSITSMKQAALATAMNSSMIIKRTITAEATMRRRSPMTTTKTNKVKATMIKWIESLLTNTILATTRASQRATLLLIPAWAMELTLMLLKCRDKNLPIVLLSATAMPTAIIEVTVVVSATSALVTILASRTVVDSAVSHLARATNSRNAIKAMDKARATVCSDSETISVVKPTAASRDTSLSIRAMVKNPASATIKKPALAMVNKPALAMVDKPALVMV